MVAVPVRRRPRGAGPLRHRRVATPDTSLEALARLEAGLRPADRRRRPGRRLGTGHRRQRARHHRRRGGDCRGQRARRRAAWTQAAGTHRRLRQAEIAPKWLFLAPVKGVRRLLGARIETSIEAFDLVEINEAFAAQMLADGRELGFDWDRGQRQRRRDRARPPHRRERCAYRDDAPPRAAPARGHAMDWRRSASVAAAQWRWPSSASALWTGFPRLAGRRYTPPNRRADPPLRPWPTHGGARCPASPSSSTRRPTSRPRSRAQRHRRRTAARDLRRRRVPGRASTCSTSASGR